MTKILDSGNRTDFGTGSVRDLQEGKGKFHLIPYETLERLAIHFENGCKKYGNRNWEKGQTISAYYDSAVRHLNKAFRGDTDEDHFSAMIWNCFCMTQTLIWIEQGILPKYLDDRPVREKISDADNILTRGIL